MNSKKRKLWGYVIRSSIYIEGDRPESSHLIEANNAAADKLEELGYNINYSGIRVVDVQNEPKDQVAT